MGLFLWRCHNRHIIATKDEVLSFVELFTNYAHETFHRHSFYPLVVMFSLYSVRLALGGDVSTIERSVLHEVPSSGPEEGGEQTPQKTRQPPAHPTSSNSNATVGALFRLVLVVLAGQHFAATSLPRKKCPRSLALGGLPEARYLLRPEAGEEPTVSAIRDLSDTHRLRQGQQV
eukprot:g28754.t1